MSRLGPAFALLLTTAALGAERPKIVVLDVAVNDASADAEDRKRVERLAAGITEQILTELSHAGRFVVVGKSDIVAMIGLERQKQLLGCSDDGSSCLAELAGALGSPYMISGALARAGSKLRLDLKLLDTVKSVVLGREGAVLEGEDQVFSVVAQLVGRLASNPAFGEAVTPAPRVPQALLIGLGAAAAVSGGVVLGVQYSQGDVLTRFPAGFTIAEAEYRRAGIYTLRPVGAALIAGGAALAALGTVWFIAAAPKGVAVVPLSGGGAYASWSAAW